MYQIVLFIETDTINMVPESWLKISPNEIDKILCYWPPSNSGQHVKKESHPEATWDLFKVRILSAEAVDYKEAQRKEKMAQNKSNLDSTLDEDQENEPKARSKRRQMVKVAHALRHQLSTDEENDEDLAKHYETPSKFLEQKETSKGRKSPRLCSKQGNSGNSNKVNTPKSSCKGSQRTLVFERSSDERIVWGLSGARDALSAQSVSVDYSSNSSSVPKDLSSTCGNEINLPETIETLSETFDTPERDGSHLMPLEMTPLLKSGSSQNALSSSKASTAIPRRKLATELNKLPVIRFNDNAVSAKVIYKGLQVIVSNQEIIYHTLNRVLNTGIATKKTCDVIETKYTSINNRLSVSVGVDENLEFVLKNLPKLPIQSLADFHILEKKLQVETNYRTLVNLLKNSGGQTAEDFAGNAMRRLVTNDAATHLNLCGRRSQTLCGADSEHKKAFDNSCTFKAVIEAMTLNPNTANEDPKVARGKIGRWLTQSKKRMRTAEKAMLQKEHQS